MHSVMFSQAHYHFCQQQQDVAGNDGTISDSYYIGQQMQYLTSDRTKQQQNIVFQTPLQQTFHLNVMRTLVCDVANPPGSFSPIERPQLERMNNDILYAKVNV